MMSRMRWFVTLALLAASVVILLALSLSWVSEVDSVGSSLSQAVALLFPTGLTLIAWSALPADRSDRVAGLATLALALAVIGYLAIGFGLHFGGAAFVSDNAELKDLSRFFSLVRGQDSAGWGLFGLEGFFLGGDAATPAALQLFVSQLPLVTAAALVVMLALPHRTPLLAQLLTGLIASAVTFPLAGHWVNGGGWLARLGDMMALGHGFVDFAGAGTVFVVAAATALAAALVFGRQRHSLVGNDPDRIDSMPPARFPILASVGALLSAVGWIAVGLSNPLYAEISETLNWSLIALNGLAGVAGGTLLAHIYSLFTTGRFDALMGPRGALAGLVAISAGAPFMPTWAALVTGAIAGLLLPLMVYAIDHILRLDDATAAIASYGLPGLWGLLAVALFADGRWGQSWNSVGGQPGNGVSGLLVAPGLRPDGGQLGAQVWGAIALCALGFVLPWGAFKLVAALSRLRLPGQAWTTRRDYATADRSNPSGESHSTPGGLDRVVNVDDGG